MTPPGIALGVKFQSTLPRRERPAIIFGDTTAWNVSIHAPTKGATPNGTSANANADVSIHAPTKGATLQLPTVNMLLFVSIHAPTKGAT